MREGEVRGNAESEIRRNEESEVEIILRMKVGEMRERK